MEKNKTEIFISWQTLWRIFAFVILIAALFIIKEVLLILLLAIVISASFDGPVNYLEKKGIPRVFGTLFLFLVIFSFSAFILYTIIPVSILEFSDFLKSLSSKEIPVFGSLDVSVWVERINQNMMGFADSLFSGGVSFFNFVLQVFGSIVLITTTIVIVFYLTLRRSGVEKFLKAILPITYEDYVIDVYLRVRRKLGLWLQGQLLLMFIVGSLLFMGLWMLGIKYSLILGIIAGVLEIVPIAGPILTGVLVFIIAISDSWLLSIYAIALVFVIQQLENHLLVPVIMKKTVDISPVVVIFAILAGAELAGLIGIILAVPVAVIFQEIIDDWEKKKINARNSRLKIENNS